ncbi:hypothetical protein LB450_04930 [Psychroflexus sp. CAK1W]|uniref:hypothetical protein n=1 Tax=Psychroflexus curvus TaxID=2873595 RepID=UPI001CCECA57|nr:hypothetical protein [Psychroflexus curvus]MBZ9627437.1 hypothetical protein [Psychroflexus curvus]
MANKSITRKELYDLVWTKPVVHIAKDYGFSDNGIRKICKKHNIPLPKNGYWSKLKFKKKVVKEKLPKQDDNPKISLEKTNPLIQGGNETLTELAFFKKDIYENQESELVVPDKLTKPHKFIKATIEYHRELKRRKRTRDYTRNLDSKNSISINVSDTIFNRGIRFMDTLIKVLEKRGFEISAERETKISKLNQDYSLRLIEKNKRIKKESKYSWPEYDLEPTGFLCLKMDSGYPKKEWNDTKTKPIEEKLINIIAWLELRSKEDYEAEIQREIRRKEREEIRKKEEALQKLKDEELEKFNTILNDASRWHKSQYLRNYIKEFEQYTKNTNTLDAKKEKWIQWAKEKADWYDPFIEKEVELLNDIDRDTLKPIKKSYW